MFDTRERFRNAEYCYECNHEMNAKRLIRSLAHWKDNPTVIIAGFVLAARSEKSAESSSRYGNLRIKNLGRQEGMGSHTLSR